jgi:ribosomal protein S18 acetylase RimI-like enzyme
VQLKHLLDNPVWEALVTEDARLNCGTEEVRYFAEDVSPFVGMRHWDDHDLAMLEKELPADRSFSVMIADQVRIPACFEIIFTTPLYQMVCTRFQPIFDSSLSMRQLGDADVPAMLELTSLTKPGPFLAHTIDFGHYIGIVEGDKLLAMAGERLHIKGYTEVSAVCTHPAYLGKGYASHLMSHACETVIQRGDVPFLHVKQDNTRAIAKYEHLGFSIRSAFYFAVIKRRG